MTTRRDFLRAMAGAAVTVVGGSALFQNCAGGLVNYRGRLVENEIAVPKAEALSLQEANGLLVVRAKGLRGPIVLRNFKNREIIATSMICTHRGCEVRPMPDSFECPCHGSAYDEYGEVLEGPARLPLQRFQVAQTSDSYIIKIV